MSFDPLLLHAVFSCEHLRLRGSLFPALSTLLRSLVLVCSVSCSPLQPAFPHVLIALALVWAFIPFLDSVEACLPMLSHSCCYQNSGKSEP